MNSSNTESNKVEIILYQPNESLKLEVQIENETVWLTQQQIADLFGVKQPAISKHLNNIFKEGELIKESVHSILEYTAADGKNYKTQFYNLDAILSVGYRVNSKNATQVRQWANNILKDYLLRGYSINRQLVALQERTDERFSKIEQRLDEHQQQIDFFIRTNLPPHEGCVFEGHLLEGREVAEQIIIDDTVYHFGASLKDLGKRLFAFDIIHLPKDLIMGEVV
ncbi:MAG: virulence RhuM family protein [Paludibacteraceae bacterium]|nr:virulence RhuM family protein [Paludibacteraceae bacterium]